MPSSEIFIVDDDPDVCAALSAVFTHAGYQATIFADGMLFVRVAHVRTPLCVLLDIRMPGPSGLDILVELDARNYPAPVFMLSGQDDIPSVVGAIRNGAFDFIEKRLGAETIVARVRDSVDSWTRGRQNRNNAQPPAFPGYEVLTHREREVLSQITAAASNKEAARNLGISPRTIEIHRARIMQKLSAKNSVDLIRIVLNKGLRA